MAKVEDSVYLDDTRYGGIESLNWIPAVDILKIQYLTPSEVTTRFGVHKGGAIFMVTTK